LNYFWPFCALPNLLSSSIMQANCRTWPSLILTSFLRMRGHCLAVIFRLITKSCEPRKTTVLSMSLAPLLLQRCLYMGKVYSHKYRSCRFEKNCWYRCMLV
jgi:hypothetical protein